MDERDVSLRRVLEADEPVSMTHLGPYCSSWQSRKKFSACPRLPSKNLQALARLFSGPHDQLCQQPPLRTASRLGPGLCLHKETILFSTPPPYRQSLVSCRISVREPESPHCTQGVR